MIKRILLFLLFLLIASVSIAADTELQGLTDNTAPLGTDVLYMVDDPAGTPLSQKITFTNLFDIIDTFAELNAIVADKTLVNEEDAINLDSLLTTLAGMNLGTSQSIIGTTAMTFGNNGQTIAINSSDWDIGATGIMTGIGAITSDGAFITTDNGITLGDTAAGDPVITFDSGNDGTITWEEDGQDFELSGDVEVAAQLRAVSGVDLGTSQALTGTTAMTIGDNGQTIAINSSDWDIGATGIATGMGDITSDGAITAGTTFTIGAAAMSEADLEQLDGITAGTAAASKALVLDGSLDIATINSLTATTLVGALTGNASTATALETARAIGGVDFDGTAAITPTTIVVADTEDATTFVGLWTDATGSLLPKTDEQLTYVASTGVMTAAGFVGPLTGAVTGNADSATLAATVTVADDEATDDEQEVVFTTNNVNLESDGTFTYNPSTGTVTATEFVGGGVGLTAIAGGNITADTILEPSLSSTNAPTDNYLLSYNAAGTNFTWVAVAGGGDMLKATYDSGDSGGVDVLTIVDSTYAGDYVMLVGAATGQLAPKTDGVLLYDSTTGILSATDFAGTGASLTAVDAITGDSATDFFDAGSIADARIDNNITIDLATLATTVTVTDDEATDDNQEIVFTTDNANLESDGNLTYNPSSGTLTSTMVASNLTTTTNIVSEPKHAVFTIINPLATQTEDNEICLWPAVPAALTVTKIIVTLDSAANEVAGDLKWADAFIGLANATVINTFDTTAGVLSDDSITAGTVASGKALYISFDSAPNTAITQMCVDVTFDYDVVP